MQESISIQGRVLSPGDVYEIRQLIENNPSWHRTRISKELCELWDWRRPDGRLKDMACRTMLLKLDRRGLISLPARIKGSNNHLRGSKIPDMLHNTDPISEELRSLQPISLLDVRHDPHNNDLFDCLMSRYHYLGFRTTVGEFVKYLIVDSSGRPLGCMLFGSSAWKCEARDSFIGWDAHTRERNLNRTTNNTRFLILPWVTVKNLASHVLSLALSQLSDDWFRHYGHRPLLVETFVDRNRFRGTCYKAANWQLVGSTTGRSRQDRSHKLSVPVKDVYVYPLSRKFQRDLQA